MHLKPAGATLWGNLMHEADPPQALRSVLQQALGNYVLLSNPHRSTREKWYFQVIEVLGGPPSVLGSQTAQSR